MVRVDISSKGYRPFTFRTAFKDYRIYKIVALQIKAYHPKIQLENVDQKKQLQINVTALQAHVSIS